MITNRSRLVAQILTTHVAPPLLTSSLYDVGADGVPRILTSASGALEPHVDARANLATILGLR